jgi:hypothetical protein
MYTTLITAGVLALIFLCMFKKRWDNSSPYNDSNFKMTVIAIFVGIVVLTQTIVTVVRMHNLPTKTGSYGSYLASPVIIKSDSVSYRFDTVVNGKTTSITKTKVDKSKRNAVIVHNHWLSVKFKDNQFLMHNNKEDKDWVITKVFVGDSVKTGIYEISTEYVTDGWVTDLIPTIDSWEEFRVNTKEYNKILSYYPEFAKLKK